jgi:hypothetical protein
MEQPKYLETLKKLLLDKSRNNDKLEKAKERLINAGIYLSRPGLTQEQLKQATALLAEINKDIIDITYDNTRLDVAIINTLELKELDFSIKIETPEKIIIGDAEVEGYVTITPGELYIMRTVCNHFGIKDPSNISVLKGD